MKATKLGFSAIACAVLSIGAFSFNANYSKAAAITQSVNDSWDEVTSLSGLNTTDLYTIATYDGNNYLNGTLSSGHFQSSAFSSTAPKKTANGVFKLVAKSSANTFSMQLVSTSKYVTATEAKSGKGALADSDDSGWTFSYNSTSSGFDVRYQKTGALAYLRNYNATFRTYSDMSNNALRIFKYIEKNVAVTGVTLNKSDTSLNVGETDALVATVAPENASNDTVSWTSSNNSVATVSNAGLVTAVSAGSAVITVTTEDGGFSASCNVTVNSVSYTDTLNLDNAQRYIQYGSYYLKVNGTTSAPSGVVGSEEPTLLTFYLVGNDTYRIGDGTNYLYATNTNNGLRFGTDSNNVWSITRNNDEYTIINTAFNRQLSCYAANPDFRVYLVGNNSANTVKLASELPSVVKSVSIDQDSLMNMEIGQTTTLTTTSSGGDVSWTSSDSTKATVTDNHDGSATVTAISGGSVTITANIDDVSDSITIFITLPTIHLEGDVLTRIETGRSDSNSYGNWTYTSSENSYAGNSAGDKDTIQMRTTNSNSGIISTGRNKNIRKVEIAWHPDTNHERTVLVYGSNKAYSSPADLYNAETYGTLLGELEYSDDPISLTIEEDYEFVGIVSSNNAIYLRAVAFTWEVSPKLTALNYIRNTDTLTQLDYDFAPADGGTYNISGIELRFGATLDASKWNALKSSITEYGVVAIYEDDLTEEGFETLQEAIDFALDCDESAAFADCVSAIDNVMMVSRNGNEPYSFNENETTFVSYKAVLPVADFIEAEWNVCAVAYVMVDGKPVFLKEAKTSAKELANAYKTNDAKVALYGDSLDAFNA